MKILFNMLVLGVILVCLFLALVALHYIIKGINIRNKEPHSPLACNKSQKHFERGLIFGAGSIFAFALTMVITVTTP